MPAWLSRLDVVVACSSCIAGTLTDASRYAFTQQKMKVFSCVGFLLSALDRGAFIVGTYCRGVAASPSVRYGEPTGAGAASTRPRAWRGTPLPLPVVCGAYHSAVGAPRGTADVTRPLRCEEPVPHSRSAPHLLWAERARPPPWRVARCAAGLNTDARSFRCTNRSRRKKDLI